MKLADALGANVKRVALGLFKLETCGRVGSKPLSPIIEINDGDLVAALQERRYIVGRRKTNRPKRSGKRLFSRSAGNWSRSRRRLLRRRLQSGMGTDVLNLKKAPTSGKILRSPP